MRILPSVVSALLLGFAVTAHADSFETFDVNAVTQGGGDITGTLTFDTSINQFTGSDMETPYGPITGAETSLGRNYTAVYFSFGIAGQTLYIVFNVPGTSLAGYAGGALCSEDAPCGDASSGILGESGGLIDSGTLTLDTGLAPTPEPSSLLLLGTGLVGLTAAARRRLARS